MTAHRRDVRKHSPPRRDGPIIFDQSEFWIGRLVQQDFVLADAPGTGTIGTNNDLVSAVLRGDSRRRTLVIYGFVSAFEVVIRLEYGAGRSVIYPEQRIKGSAGANGVYGNVHSLTTSALETPNIQIVATTIYILGVTRAGVGGRSGAGIHVATVIVVACANP